MFRHLCSLLFEEHGPAGQLCEIECTEGWILVDRNDDSISKSLPTSAHSSSPKEYLDDPPSEEFYICDDWLLEIDPEKSSPTSSLNFCTALPACSKSCDDIDGFLFPNSCDTFQRDDNNDEASPALCPPLKTDVDGYYVEEDWVFAPSPPPSCSHPFLSELPRSNEVHTLEESWLLTPPPCFAARPSHGLEPSPLENLLIEHPSMSVYAVYHHGQKQDVYDGHSISNDCKKAGPNPGGKRDAATNNSSDKMRGRVVDARVEKAQRKVKGTGDSTDKQQTRNSRPPHRTIIHSRTPAEPRPTVNLIRRSGHVQSGCHQPILSRRQLFRNNQTKFRSKQTWKGTLRFGGLKQPITQARDSVS
uniref:uncharacterized protein n=1 Tax=Myxine glutinosa TaxID=7769 RepID=UPI00358FA51E